MNYSKMGAAVILGFCLSSGCFGAEETANLEKQEQKKKAMQHALEIGLGRAKDTLSAEEVAALQETLADLQEGAQRIKERMQKRAMRHAKPSSTSNQK